MMNVQILRNYTFILFAFVLCLTFAPRQSHSQGVMRIAAVVNDSVISAHDLSQRVRLTISTTRMPNTPEVRKRLTSSILKTMIDERLKVQEGERLGIEVTDEQVTKGLGGYARSQKINPANLDQALIRMGVDPEVLKDQARAEISWLRSVNRTGRSRLNVSDNEINAALATIHANKGKPEYLYSEIFLSIEDTSQENNVVQMANRLIGHIQNGSPFPALARDFSQSPSAVRGGDLGWVQSGNVSEQIENALAQLPLNGYSNPIRTVSGFHILHLRDKRIAGQEDETLDISQVILALNQNANTDERATKIATARNLIQRAQSCDMLDAMGKDIGNAKSGRVKDITLSKMPAELRTIVRPLVKGQSAIHDQKGAILVLMVCEREEISAMPEIAKRKLIKNKLRQERVAREGRRLLQKLRRSAFVDIRL